MESEGGDGGRGRRRGVRAAFPVPNYEPRVCTWGCSVAPGAEKEQRRRAERSDGGAEEAEVRVGELPGPPRHSGNGLAARRAVPGGGALLLVASRHAGTPPRPLSTWAGAGDGGCSARPAREGRALPGPGSGAAGGRAERGNVSGPCRRAPLSPRAPRRGPGGGRAGGAGPPPAAGTLCGGSDVKT